MKTKITESRRLNILGNGEVLAAGAQLNSVLNAWRQKVGFYSLCAAVTAIFGSGAQETRAEEPVIVSDLSSTAEQGAAVMKKLTQRCGKPELLRRASEYRLPGQRSEYNILTAFAGRDDCPGAPIPSGTYTSAAPFMDTGTTVGADNTINETRFVDYCYYAYEAGGPDQIYSFTLTGLGSNPKIQVSTSSSVYRPLIYVMSNKFNRVGCPGGTGNSVCGLHIAAYAQNGTATLARESMRLSAKCSSFLVYRCPEGRGGFVRPLYASNAGCRRRTCGSSSCISLGETKV